MLDSSCSETPKTKKKTAQNRPVQRFWPDSIASGVAQPPPSELTMSEGMGGRPRPDMVDRGVGILNKRPGLGLLALSLRSRGEGKYMWFSFSATKT